MLGVGATAAGGRRSTATADGAGRPDGHPGGRRPADADVVRGRRRQGVRGRRRQRVEQGAERRRVSAQRRQGRQARRARRTSCPGWPGTRARCTSPAARSRRTARSGRSSAGAASTARRSPSARRSGPRRRASGFNGIAFAPNGRLFVGVDVGLTNNNDHGPAKTPVRVRHPVDEGRRQRREGLRHRHPPAVADGLREGFERPVRLGPRPGQGREEPAGLRAAGQARATTTGSRSATGPRAARARATPSRSRCSRPTPTSWGWRSSASGCT